MHEVKKCVGNQDGSDDMQWAAWALLRLRTSMSDDWHEEMDVWTDKLMEGVRSCMDSYEDGPLVGEEGWSGVAQKRVGVQ